MKFTVSQSAFLQTALDISKGIGSNTTSPFSLEGIYLSKHFTMLELQPVDLNYFY